MSEAVFSASYAAGLVQRARDGATWDLLLDGRRWPRRLCGAGRDHWVAWYRETRGVYRWFVDESNNGMRWCVAARSQLRDLVYAFEDAADAIGSLCQLPETWTEAHRALAREMRGR